MKTVTCGATYAITAGAMMLLAAGASKAQESWTDTISFKGDVRLRYDGIREEGSADRDRGRFRARLGITADVNDNVKAIVRLATGGGNPVSTNQSFDGGFSRKDIGLDQAYLDWTPNDKTHVYGGKMSNPLHRAGGHALVWDSDLNPEGVAIQYETGGFFGTAALLFVEERSSSDDSLLMAVQGGYVFNLSDGAKLTAGVGYMNYTDTVGNQPFYDGNPRGNSVDLNGNLVLDYKQAEFFAEWDTKLGDLPFSVFANFVQNSEASAADSGFAIGAAIGDAGDPGTWQASWAYQELEADALISTFTDSDVGGGGTDNEGHVFKARYVLADNWSLAGQLYLNEVGAFAGNARDYDRVILDLEFRF